ncbi:superoxide dismutase family protein [Rummeliibacillus sp. TYF005]|uniref:superoxide dismutase family protein n=1 Tax=Rummeliibacillus sp. TYF005 TaxID=2058214 RepID=UPI000F539ECC|nr:superoxide dismutase family protein [Rummeliibacillus sp. TYF005]RPJ94485.1 superoxide dismutase family protein [Rummeliibacillus sp. TYF005]
MKKILLIIATISLIAGCSASKEDSEMKAVNGEKSVTAKADFINSEGKDIGTANLTQTDQGVKIDLKLKDLSPGTHGIHIHEVGICEKPKFESAGAHFNPTQKQHGYNNPKGYHLGDLPNIQVEEDGTVDVEFTTKDFTIEKGAEHSLFDDNGSAFIIHADKDDYITDPSGNSGDRIACGVIK